MYLISRKSNKSQSITLIIIKINIIFFKCSVIKKRVLKHSYIAVCLVKSVKKPESKKLLCDQISFLLKLLFNF